MTRPIPMTLATIVALLAGGSTALAPETSRAAPAGAWTGSATCTLTTAGPFSYQNQQVHSWKISPGAAQTQNGAARLYAYTWRDTGRGTRAGTVSWAINGHGAGNIAFRTNPLNGTLYIGIQGGAGVDSQGITVSDSTGGSTRIYAAPAYEWPFPLITARAGSTSVVAAPHAVPVNGSVGFQQTAGSKTSAVCSWNFRFGAEQSPAAVLSTAPLRGSTGRNVPTPQNVTIVQLTTLAVRFIASRAPDDIAESIMLPAS